MEISENKQIELVFDVFDVIVDPDNSPDGVVDWKSFNGTLIALAFVENNTQSFLGSAVMVAPGIAIGAKHVVNDFRSKLQDNSVSLIGCGVTESGLELWKAWSVTIVEGTDLALMSFDLISPIANDRVFGLAGLSVRIPVVGQIATILGFRPSEAEFTLSETNEVSFAGRVIYGHGEITQVFPHGRDRVMLPGPSFEIDCPAVGAMSGGPVYDESGHVIGILSSSVSSFSDGGPSYASHLGCALKANLSGGWRVMPALSKPTTLKTLADSLCFVFDPQ